MKLDILSKDKINGIFLLLSVIFLTALANGCMFDSDSGTAAALKKYDNAAIAVVNKIIENNMLKKNIPGALAGVWDEGYETLIVSKGKADIAANIDVNPNMRFRMASTCKMFTALSILILAGENKLSLDDKVSKYLPDLPHADKVTIRQLGNHTSGYFNYTSAPGIGVVVQDPLKVWTPQELMDLVKDKPLDFEPGTRYKYSNTGFIVLGMIIEKVSGKKFGEFIDEKIIKPLNMTDTTYPAAAAINGEHMNGYVINTGETAPVEFLLAPSVAWAAGGTVSSLNDMKKFLDALAAGSLISPAMRLEQKKWVETDTAGTKYGFGIFFEKNNFIGHTGDTIGYNVSAFISLDSKKTVIVIHNLDDLAPATSNDLMKYLFNY